MFDLGHVDPTSPLTVFYETLIGQIKAVTDGEPDLVANTANISSLLWHSFKDRKEDKLSSANWIGFYFLKKSNELVLGPFHGKIACIRIRTNRGVCGKTVVDNATQFVPDVHLFPGHIACDSETNSEIVIPLRRPDGSVFGVFDLDNVLVDGWSEIDVYYMEQVARIIEDRCATHLEF